MKAYLLVAAVVALAGIGAWLLLGGRTLVSPWFERLTGRRRAPRVVPVAGNEIPQQRYAVVRWDDGEPCAAVLGLRGRTFTANDLPGLPLGGCDAPRCRCYFRYFSDRRTGVRRGGSERRKAIRYEPGSVDRRRRAGRRASESVWDRDDSYDC